MLIRSLQRALETLHGIEPTIDIEPFLINQQIHAAMPGAVADLPEQVFVSEQDGCMDIAVYIEPAVVAALEQDDPRDGLHDGNLENFCIALEGISHFVLLIDRARSGRALRPLELEIQAEVDKFVHAWLLMTEQGLPIQQTARYLCRRLFERYSLRPGISGAIAERYHTATTVARRYCRRLIGKDTDGLRDPRLRGDLRQFYRCALPGKLVA